MKTIITLALLLTALTAHATIFPTEKSKMIYSVAYGPSDNPSEVLTGKLTLDLYEVKANNGTITTKYQESSSVFPRYKFFEVAESSDSIILNGVTYIGPGSDEIYEAASLMPAPLKIGSKVDTPLIYSKVKAEQKLTIMGKIVTAFKLNVIGSYDGFYTMTGDYWVVKGLGIVKADYTTVDGWNVSYELVNIKK